MPLSPFLLTQFHPFLNKEVNKNLLSPGSDKKIWWQCSEGHEWEARISSRVSGASCPYCSGRLAIPGVSDLATTHPKIAEQWHPTKNTMKSNEVKAGSDKKAWWLGKECGHEWESSVANRVKGSGCLICAGKIVLSGFNDLATLNPAVAKQWHPTKNGNLTPEQITVASGKKVWWQCDSGHEWESPVDRRTGSGRGCPVCTGVKQNKTVEVNSKPLTSEPTLQEAPATKQNKNETKTPDKELEQIYGNYVVKEAESEHKIVDFLTGLNIKFETNTSEIISPQELDIYVPEKKIAIEFNGLYGHSELGGKGKWYHHTKWAACQEQGIQLIQVWEDDWNRNPDIVKSMLAHKLNASSLPKVYARNTEVIRLQKIDMMDFLNENHIQGFVGSSRYYGLADKRTGSLVAATAVTIVEGGVVKLERFATSQPVLGGFTKLLNYVEKEHNPPEIFTFSDNCVSDGGLYEKNGFEAVKIITPDYMYVVDGKRKHKFGYRLVKFRNDPDLKWVEGYTERELAQLNNLPRIWDAGKVKWVKKLN